MEELDNLVSESLNRYFTVLESLGQISNADTNKLILLSFIQEFLGEYQGYITEEDYRVIDSIIQCLAGTSCLIPYGQYQQLSTPVTGYTFNIPYRVNVQSDGQHLRAIEYKNGLRLVNQ